MAQTIEEILAEELAYEQTQTYNGYTIATLRTVFDALSNPADWKAPITALMQGELVNNNAACDAEHADDALPRGKRGISARTGR